MKFIECVEKFYEKIRFYRSKIMDHICNYKLGLFKEIILGRIKNIFDQLLVSVFKSYGTPRGRGTIIPSGSGSHLLGFGQME